MRLLIKRFPDLAKDVFDKCVTTNMHRQVPGQPDLPRSHDHRAKSVSADSPNLKIIMDYEFVDDTYSILTEVEREEDVAAEEREVWDDKGRLLPNSRPYSTSR